MITAQEAVDLAVTSIPVAVSVLKQIEEEVRSSCAGGATSMRITFNQVLEQTLVDLLLAKLVCLGYEASSIRNDDKTVMFVSWLRPNR